MADISLDTFKSRLKDVARPNRFLVTLNNPVGGNAEELSFFVKSASLPGMTVGPIEIPFQGMKTKIAGDPEFEDWTVGLYADYDMQARSMFEKWHELIIKKQKNTRTAPSEYKADLIVQQLGRNGEILRQYKIIGAWPTAVEQIELSNESENTPEEFSVTISYDYWELIT